MRNAVIVAGHAIVRDYARPFDDASWTLQSFQRGEAACYVEHIRQGVELAAADPEAMLIFSGGQTRVDAGPRSEAESYHGLAEHLDWFGREAVAPRAVREEYARDSFENVLFSLCRFHEVAGCWPRQITIVSWRFKQDRFDLHRTAARWPADAFVYAGVNDPPDLAGAVAGESRTLAAFQRNPYGATGDLAAKRQARNPFGRFHEYGKRCPLVAGLLEHSGPEMFAGSLPWDAVS